MIRTVVITPADIMAAEAAAICRMLRSGAWRVHVRHPQASAAGIESIIAEIPAELRSRISLHDHHGLAARMGIGGVHLNGRNPEAPEGWTGIVSRSCHSLEELKEHPEADYLFLSPVFDSISKEGYRSGFSLAELADAELGERVFALGGVRPRHFALLKSLGFGGAAMLGAAWQPFAAGDFRLQYITPAAENIHTLAMGVEEALMGGCRWVQLRMKDASPAAVAEAAALVEPLCRRFGAIFLLDDHVELVRATGADGVHVGKNDMPVAEARRLLGPGTIIGATANTLADMEAAWRDGADYIGLGPFRFTTTKKNLSPTLGTEGYATLMAEARAKGVDIPVVAIGGIEPADIAAIATTGVNGVAISGAIAKAAGPVEKTQEFINLLNTYLTCKN